MSYYTALAALIQDITQHDYTLEALTEKYRVFKTSYPHRSLPYVPTTTIGDKMHSIALTTAATTHFGLLGFRFVSQLMPLAEKIIYNEDISIDEIATLFAEIREQTRDTIDVEWPQIFLLYAIRVGINFSPLFESQPNNTNLMHFIAE